MRISFSDVGWNVIFILVILSWSSYFIFLNQVGGLLHLLANLSEKSEVIRGSGLFRLIFINGSFALALPLIIMCARNNRSLSVRCFFWLVVVINFLMLASYGERKNAMVFLVILGAGWHLFIRPIKILSPGILLLGTFIIGFSSLAPPLRVPGASSAYLENPTQLFLDALPYAGEVFRRFSDFDISIFILNYYDQSAFWLKNQTTLNFLTGIIPSSLYNEKPVLDEALIVYNTANGNPLPFSAPFREYIPVGWPLSRYTSGYAHWGWYGAIIYSMLTSAMLIFINNACAKISALVFFPIYIVSVVSAAGLTNAFIFHSIISFLMIFLSINVARVFR